jgi:hypothetical protein
MESELEKFQESAEISESNLKLIVDFESTKLEPIKNQMEIEGIKYKKAQIKKGGTLDLSKKNKKKNNDNTLF